MIPLKSDYSYAWLSDEGQASGKEIGEGYFRFDTRHLSRYQWSFQPQATVLMTDHRVNRFFSHFSVQAYHTEVISIQRYLTMTPEGFEDRVVVRNRGLEKQTINLSLEAETDFADLFSLRGHWHAAQSKPVIGKKEEKQWIFDYSAFDGVKHTTILSFSEESNEGHWKIALAPQEEWSLTVTARFLSDLDCVERVILPSYKEWRSQFMFPLANPIAKKAFERSCEDLWGLLLATDQGLYPAAGIPFFVTPFGRDGLLTAFMVLDDVPEVAKGVLRKLASLQGMKTEAYYEEEPGKIFHEIRNCEMARKKEIPFLAYYGTADATPLFIKLAADYYEKTQDITLIQELQSAIICAIEWILSKQDKDTKLIHFNPEGQGLKVQSWKDSNDSMSHSDGRLAKNPVAVVEVQGYAYAAFQGASKLMRSLGENEKATLYQEKAKELFNKIQQFYWLEELGTYALALDGDNQPLEVRSSDPGHLLWCNAVPQDKAKHLIATMMSNDLWSGYGIRTLGKNEVRYNPLGYHVGTIWPHDTAIFAVGCLQYGDKDTFSAIAKAAVKFTEKSNDYTLPEVSGGFDKDEHPPIPYIESCRPQAWAAASMLWLARLGQEIGMELFKEA